MRWRGISRLRSVNTVGVLVDENELDLMTDSHSKKFSVTSALTCQGVQSTALSASSTIPMW